jgi:hypothetical protein
MYDLGMTERVLQDTTTRITEIRAAGIALSPAATARPAMAQRQSASPAGQSASRQSLLDLIWKIDCRGGTWSAALRNDPSVIVTAGNGDQLGQLARDLTVAILEGRGANALRAITEAAAA